MSVTERIMSAGSWDLELSQDTPRRLLELIDVERAGFSSLVITPAHMDPRNHTDASMLAAARYSGAFRAQETDYSMSGVGSSALLGDEDGKGDIYESARSTADGWLSQWATSLRPMSLLAGTVTSPGGVYDGTFFLTTAKKALETVCEHFGVEWRVTPDFRLHIGSAAALYGAAPRLIVLHNAGDGGRDFARLPSGVASVLVGVSTAGAGLSRDLEDYTTKVVYSTEETVASTKSDIATTSNGTTVNGKTSVTERQTVTTLTTAATPDAAVPFKRPADGGPVILDRHIDGKTEDGSSPQTLADRALAEYGIVRRDVQVDGGSADISHLAPVGSFVYVYAPPVVADAANPVWYRGQQITPVLTRLTGSTWPIRRGSGVYLRQWTGLAAPVWHDLTPYVVWESGTTRLEVGAAPRPSRNQ